MAGFDASVIGSIGQQPDVPGAVTRGFQLKDLADQNQLNQLNLQSKKRDMADAETLRDVLKGSDLSTDKGVAEASSKLTQAGLPEAAMRVRSQAQQITSGELDNQVKQLQLHEGMLDYMAQVFDPAFETATAMRNARDAQGRPQYTDAQVSAYIQSQVPTVIKHIQDAPDDVLPAQVKQAALQKAASGQGAPKTYDDLQRIEMQSRQTREQLTARLQQLNIGSEITARGDEAKTRAADLAERQRHDRATESGGRYGIKEPTTEAGQDLKDSYIGAVGGKVTLGQLRGMDFDRLAATGQTADKLIKSGVATAAATREATSAATQGGKTLTGEYELEGFAPLTIAASDAVPRGKFVPIAKLLQMSEASISDPDLKELKVRVNTFLNAYDTLTARGGTDPEKRRINRQNLLAADSKEAFTRAINTMLSEGRIAVGAVRAAEGRGAAPDSSAAAAPSGKVLTYDPKTGGFQ